MKLCSIGYVPPPKQGLNPASFLANVNRFKTKFPLLLYTEHSWPECEIKLPVNPENVIPNPPPRLASGEPNRWALNNLLFLTGMRIAHKHGYSHVIYLESDCRVGCDNWDKQIFDEFFTHDSPLICAGSLVCYNPCTYNRRGYDRWMALIERHNSARNFPIPTYGWRGVSSPTGDSSVFPNGALGVYDVTWITKLFNLEDSVKEACSVFAWDFAIGERIWSKFGADSYDFVKHLRTIYSSYGDTLSTEAERLSWLRDGKLVGVHQVKSDAIL